MKSTIKLLTIGAAVIGLAACASGAATMDDYTNAPYTMERTAGHAMAKADADNTCSDWRARALAAEEKLRRMESRFNASMRK